MLLRTIKKVLVLGWDLVDEKVLEFLQDVFKGRTGKFLDKHHDIINEAVDTVDEVVKLVTTKKSKGEFNLSRELSIEWDINLRESEIDILVSNNRKSNILRHEMAYDLIQRDLQNRNKNL